MASACHRRTSNLQLSSTPVRLRHVVDIENISKLEDSCECRYRLDLRDPPGHLAVEGSDQPQDEDRHHSCALLGILVSLAQMLTNTSPTLMRRQGYHRRHSQNVLSRRLRERR